MEKLQLMALEAVRREPSLELAAEVLSSYIESLEYKLTEGVSFTDRLPEVPTIKLERNGQPCDPILHGEAVEPGELCIDTECGGPAPMAPSDEDLACIAKSVMAATFKGLSRDILMLLARYPGGLTLDQMLRVTGKSGDKTKWFMALHRHVRKGGVRSYRGAMKRVYYRLTYWDNPRPDYWSRTQMRNQAVAPAKARNVAKARIGSREDGMVVALRADGVPFIEIVMDYARDHNIDWTVARPKIMSIFNRHRQHIEALRNLTPGQARFDYLSKWFEGWGTHAPATSSA